MALGAAAHSYMDDLVAYGRNLGPSEVADVCEVTERFGGAFGFVLNASKSVQCSSSAEVRAELRLMPGPPLGVAFKDSGLGQHFGGAAPELERVRQCEGRFQRCVERRLPPCPTRPCASSASGPRARSPERGSGLCRRHFTCCMGSHGGRMWPRALAAGACEATLLRRLAEGPRRGGPLHAAAAALQRCASLLTAAGGGLWPPFQPAGSSGGSFCAPVSRPGRWLARCRRCGAEACGFTTGWRELLRSPCSGEVTFRDGPRSLAAVGGGSRCDRRGLFGAS